uniref:Uncharacterized protein n=1 Tax=Picea glauca TaxID=3330 RepID=A0A101M1B1_PICGL|nr:hypothetical protein ABT39_MTgene4402 [Picea glauca]QHR86227.1 hypothetical protein Q903MT_gene226 [Picea sitchensis]
MFHLSNPAYGVLTIKLVEIYFRESVPHLMLMITKELLGVGQRGETHPSFFR